MRSPLNLGANIPKSLQGSRLQNCTTEHLEPLSAGQKSKIDRLHLCSKLSNLNLCRIRASKPGGTWRDWPRELIAECHTKKSGKTYPGVYGRLGIPQIYLLQPVEYLRSRIVVIKGYEEPESFLQAVQRQIEQLGIQGTASIPINADGKPKRRTIKIKRFTVVGFGLEVMNLSDEDSLTLQMYGIGGKQKMGCGVFVPSKER